MLAQELCHLLHDAGVQDLTTRVSWGTVSSGHYDDALEVRARAFASAFLAPPAQVVAWARERGLSASDARALVLALAVEWGLSFEGAVYHAKSCQLVSPEAAEVLLHQPRQRRTDLRVFEGVEPVTDPGAVHEHLPSPPAPLWRGAGTQMVLAALRDGHGGASEGAAHLGLSAGKMVWSVDDGPLDHPALVVAPEQASTWPHGELLMAYATARSARGKRQTLLEASGSPFEVFPAFLGTPTWDVVHDHLRDGSTTDKDLAVHESIAWALVERNDGGPVDVVGCGASRARPLRRDGDGVVRQGRPAREREERRSAQDEEVRRCARELRDDLRDADYRRHPG